MAYMTEQQKIARVQMLVENDPNATNEVITELLAQAADAIVDVVYQFPEEGEVYTMPTKYGSEQCALAARYFARMGANGETVHNENGINRTWASPDDADILRKCTPKVRFY